MPSLSLPISANAALREAHWLFFDLGSTLVNEEAATVCRIQLMVEALARRGRHYTSDEVRSTFEEEWARFSPRPVISVLEKLVDEPACRSAILKEAPYPKNLEVLFDGAEEVLRTLAVSYKIGIIANQTLSSTERLLKWGLMPYISTCLCSFELGLEKPDPAIFHQALDRAGCAASQAIIIGDRLDNDIRPARLLGWKTIRVLQGFARFQSPRDIWDQPDLTVPDVKALIG